MKHLKEHLNKELVSLDAKVKKQGGLKESDISIAHKIYETLEAMKGAHMSYSDDISIEDELSGAEKYLKHYEKTGKEMFKNLAHDEMKHAKMLMEHTPEMKDKQMLMDWYADIENRMNGSMPKTSRL